MRYEWQFYNDFDGSPRSGRLMDKESAREVVWFSYSLNNNRWEAVILGHDKTLYGTNRESLIRQTEEYIKKLN